MSTLYIIGNGLDLHHGIQSSYWCYMKWLETNYPELFKEIEHTFRGATKESWWADFENGLGHVDWFYNLNAAAKPTYKVGDVNVSGKKSPARLIALYAAIQESFSQWVRSLDSQVKSVDPDLDIDTDARFLTFNYTNTLQCTYSVPDGNILHIHGNAERGDKIVVGHNTSGNKFMLRQLDTIGEVSGTFKMKKAISAYQKPTLHIIDMNQLFFESLSNIQQVVVCGFSFSSVDMPYVKEIINNLPEDAKWQVFIHSDRDKDHMVMVQNDLNLKMEFVEW